MRHQRLPSREPEIDRGLQRCSVAPGRLPAAPGSKAKCACRHGAADVDHHVEVLHREIDVARDGAIAPDRLVMSAAGPGTITAVVTLAAVHTPDGWPLSALAASAVGAGVTFGVLLLASQLGSHVNQNTQAIVTRFMGLIVTAMGMQFVLTGYKTFMQS